MNLGILPVTYANLENQRCQTLDALVPEIMDEITGCLKGAPAAVHPIFNHLSRVKLITESYFSQCWFFGINLGIFFARSDRVKGTRAQKQTQDAPHTLQAC